MADEKKLVGRLDKPGFKPPPPSLSQTSTNININIILTELRNRSRRQPQQLSEWFSVCLRSNEYENLLALIEANKDLQGVKYIRRFILFYLVLTNTRLGTTISLHCASLS